MKNNIKKGGACPCSRIQQGGCGCSEGLGFPLSGGGQFGKMRAERVEKQQEKRKEKIMKGSNNILSIAQANPDAFKMLCSIIPSTRGGQNLQGMAMSSSAVSMPFPLNLLKNPMQVQQVCSQIAANPAILTAPIASEVKTANGSTVQEHIDQLHNAAVSGTAVTGSYGMSGPSYGMGAATSAGPSGGGMFDMFQEEKPNARNIIANNGRTVHEHLEELHENLHVQMNNSSKRHNSTKRNNSTKRHNSEVGLFGGKLTRKRKLRKTRKTRTK